MQVWEKAQIPIGALSWSPGGVAARPPEAPGSAGGGLGRARRAVGSGVPNGAGGRPAGADVHTPGRGRVVRQPPHRQEGRERHDLVVDGRGVEHEHVVERDPGLHLGAVHEPPGASGRPPRAAATSAHRRAAAGARRRGPRPRRVAAKQDDCLPAEPPRKQAAGRDVGAAGDAEPAARAVLGDHAGPRQVAFVLPDRDVVADLGDERAHLHGAHEARGPGALRPREVEVPHRRGDSQRGGLAVDRRREHDLPGVHAVAGDEVLDERPAEADHPHREHRADRVRAGAQGASRERVPRAQDRPLRGGGLQRLDLGVAVDEAEVRGVHVAGDDEPAPEPGAGGRPAAAEVPREAERVPAGGEGGSGIRSWVLIGRDVGPVAARAHRDDAVPLGLAEGEVAVGGEGGDGEEGEHGGPRVPPSSTRAPAPAALPRVSGHAAPGGWRGPRRATLPP